MLALKLPRGGTSSLNYVINVPVKIKKTDVSRTVLGHSYSFDKNTISSIVVKSY